MLRCAACCPAPPACCTAQCPHLAAVTPYRQRCLLDSSCLLPGCRQPQATVCGWCASCQTPPAWWARPRQPCESPWGVPALALHPTTGQPCIWRVLAASCRLIRGRLQEFSHASLPACASAGRACCLCVVPGQRAHRCNRGPGRRCLGGKADDSDAQLVQRLFDAVGKVGADGAGWRAA